MKRLTEGRKMWISVMVIFAIYAIIFMLFEDIDRERWHQPFNEDSDWHLLLFSVIVMFGLAWLLNQYANKMDERISKEQSEKEERMRRELTQNISHELKTPLASILGYTETILDNPEMDKNTLKQFVVRTNNQAQRLTNLLQDLSTLNRMDYATEMIMMHRTDISSIVADISEETALNLSQKNMKLLNFLPEGIVVKGNESLLYSIFRNLIDNAVNYAGDGCTIELDAQEEPTQWRFWVKDNGQGIEKEHLTRIFERFYRINKGRSRSQGGTGLGLSIVKNAVRLHGGIIIIRSEGIGVEFEFTIKK